LPYEEVGGEAYQEFAIRSLNDELEIVVAAQIAGNHVFRISASDCIGVQFDTALLCSEVTVFSQQGNPIRCRYNSVGEPLVQTVLEPFLTSLFSKSANVGLSKAISENGNADLRMFSGLFSPAESYMAVEQPRKVVRSVRRLLRTTQEVLPQVSDSLHVVL
jgi:hypothetical protein